MAQMESNLAQQVLDAIQSDERTVDAPIDVIDNNGMITLTGWVRSNEDRDAATAIAESTPGVMSVITDIEVDHSDQFTPRIPIAPTHLGQGDGTVNRF
jgi:osmotically-inducible protein OsmY